MVALKCSVIYILWSIYWECNIYWKRLLAEAEGVQLGSEVAVSLVVLDEAEEVVRVGDLSRVSPSGQEAPLPLE